MTLGPIFTEPHQNAVETYSKKPSDCSTDELKAFEGLVLKGGEVSAVGLPGRIRRAKLLVFSREGDRLIGVAAIKKPGEDYQSRTAAKSKLDLPKELWPYELGWVFLEEDARGKRLSHALVACALDGLCTALFATSRAENNSMHAALTRAGFKQEGECYPSDHHAGWMVVFRRRKPLEDKEDLERTYN